MVISSWIYSEFQQYPDWAFLAFESLNDSFPVEDGQCLNSQRSTVLQTAGLITKKFFKLGRGDLACLTEHVLCLKCSTKALMF
jgi:hypothetical protein